MIALDTVDRAVTVRQPYAQCIASGRKLIENRGRPTSYRGPIAIHAAQAEHPRGKTDPRVIALYGVDPAVDMPRGAVVGVAELVDCHPAENRAPGRTCCEPWGEPTYKGGHCFHYVLDQAVLLVRPVPARGSLTLPWLLPVAPVDVRGQVRAALAEAVTLS